MTNRIMQLSRAEAARVQRLFAGLYPNRDTPSAALSCLCVSPQGRSGWLG
jgi:hypothetical protein